MPSMFQDPLPTSSPDPTDPTDPADSSSRDATASANHLDDDPDADENVQQLANAVSRVNEKLPDGVQTTREAYSVCKHFVQEQLERAKVDRIMPNVATTGDASARNAVLLLLTDTQQRTLFLHVAGDRQSWGRIRPLFGSPPYNFLRPHDAGMFAAGGFARGRVNMTYDDVKAAASTAQFGPGQLVDEYGREYRVASERDQSYSDLLPGNDYFNVKRGNIFLQVKIKKHSKTKKLALMRSEDRKQVLFPRPGEVVTLRESRGLLSARGARVSVPTDLRVRGLFPRGVGSSTAGIVLSLV